MDIKDAAEGVREWHDFYLLAGTAAATLLGLLFIAVTLNADLILAGSRPHTKRVAEQAFQNYIAVLMLSMIFLEHGYPNRVIAVQMVTLSFVMTLWSVQRLRSALSVSDESFNKSRTLRRLLPSLLGYFLMLEAALRVRYRRSASVRFCTNTAVNLGHRYLVGPAGARGRNQAQQAACFKRDKRMISSRKCRVISSRSPRASTGHRAQAASARILPLCSRSRLENRHRASRFCHSRW